MISPYTTGRASTVTGTNLQSSVSFADGDINILPTENQIYRPLFAGGLISNIFVYQDLNTLTSNMTITSRVNSADKNQSATIVAMAADSEITDSVNRDAVVAGDFVTMLKWNMVAGGSIALPMNSILIDSIGRLVHSYVGSNHAGNAANTQNFYNVGGTWSQTTEAGEHKLKSRVAGIIRYFVYNCQTNTTNDNVTFGMRLNGADEGGIVVTIGNGAGTGQFTDLVNSRAIVVGDLWNKYSKTLVGHTGVASCFNLYNDFTPIANYLQPVNAIPAAELSNNAGDAAMFLPLQGRLILDANTVAQQYKMLTPSFVSNYGAYLSANTINQNGKIECFPNSGASGPSITITLSGGAGWYEDNVNKKGLVYNDRIQNKYTPGTGSGASKSDYVTCLQIITGRGMFNNTFN